ncbi:hypothetical protein AAG570_006937 [Ranatra chinensis]|uniref:Uncharacterized protein n=1 Tax=Ranatra chinensis TaxID=642074 RepID=A0ABD0YVR2_9HEMI
MLRSARLGRLYSVFIPEAELPQSIITFPRDGAKVTAGLEHFLRDGQATFVPRIPAQNTRTLNVPCRFPVISLPYHLFAHSARVIVKIGVNNFPYNSAHLLYVIVEAIATPKVNDIIKTFLRIILE